jgi:hypothetical protein
MIGDGVPMKDHDTCRRAAVTNGAHFTCLLRWGYNKGGWIGLREATGFFPQSIFIKGCNNPVDGFF